MKELIFKVKSTGLPPERKKQLIALIEKRVDEALCDIECNVPFIFPLAKELSPQEEKKIS